MKFDGKRLSKVAALALVCLVAASCSTVAPGVVSSAEPGWDAGGQNSGILAETENQEFIITARARERYNGLISAFGSKFSPPLKPDDGLRPAEGSDGWVMSATAMEHFATMSRWRKQQAPPWGQ